VESGRRGGHESRKETLRDVKGEKEEGIGGIRKGHGG
jgi:hypothetical protein